MVSSEFISKIEFACKKKESLYNQSKFKYAIRSMFAGAFLTFSTAAGAVGADLINKIAPGSGRFLFPFVFAWGLAYIVFLNAELVTSNMMFLTAGSFLKKISWRKTAEILLYCTLFNLIGALIAGWGFAHSAAYAHLTHDSFISVDSCTCWSTGAKTPATPLSTAWESPTTTSCRERAKAGTTWLNGSG